VNLSTLLLVAQTWAARLEQRGLRRERARLEALGEGLLLELSRNSYDAHAVQARLDGLAEALRQRETDRRFPRPSGS
jgi:hypothetical protein